jgi:antitoxin component HigA of HigAB toxin-antitoxin module
MKLKSIVKPTRDDYLELVKRFPLRVIRTERELDAATTVAIQVAAKGEAALSEGENEYLEVLDRLIEDYEDVFHGMPVGNTTPLERLRSLAAEAGLSASDLGRLLGNRSLGSLLLTGRRELSKAHVRVLAEHFKVNAGYFL